MQSMNLMNFNNGIMNMNGVPAAFMPGMPNPFSTTDITGMHNPGAVRRGGGAGRYTNRSGPYDRNNRGTRNGGFTGGRPGPPMVSVGMGMGYVAQGGGGGGGKWGDGAGGGMNAMGPREAVQGRSIKSYEDLDAQPGGGGGGGGATAGGDAGGAELDY